MNKIKIIFVLISLLCGVSAFAESTTYYYSTVTVKSQTANGLVYVSEKNEKPSDTDYKESMTIDLKKTSESTQVYLFAKSEEGRMLEYWLDQDGNKVTEFKVDGSTDEKNPKEYCFTAVFSESMPDLIVKPSDSGLGNVTIDKVMNVVGDKVTITASLAEPWAGGMGVKKWSKSHAFDGWYDEEGNCVSKDAKYTFTIERPAVYTARFIWRQFVQGAGFYRVRYSYNQQFRELKGQYDPTPGMFITHDSRKLNGVLDLSVINDFSNPATVMFLDANSFDLLDSYKEEYQVAKGISLESQGVSTSQVLKKYTLNLQTCHNVGFYKIIAGGNQIAANEHNYGSADNPNLGYLYVNSDQTGKSESDPDSYFEFEPLDEDHIDEFYFGAEPAEDMTYDGGYWTSMYTSFAYECRDGVEAYYIEEVNTDFAEPIAVLVKIEDGIVPAKTAVLLKCNGLTAKENRLLPIVNGPAAIENNLLHGEFQLAKSKDKPEYVTFDGSKMRVFSVKDGVVGFYRMAEGTVLAANRAWLDVSGLTSSNNARVIIRHDVSGVEDIAIEDADKDDVIYDLYGRRVENPVAGQIYIVNGKKTILK